MQERMMTGENVVNPPQQSVAEFLESLRSANNLQKLLIERAIEQAAAKHAGMREAIRYCAIPRRFDEEIIGVLRGNSDDSTTDEAIFNEVLDQDFVLSRRDGGYVYHDNVRDLLLSQWREEGSREEFDEYNRRLEDFYVARHGDARDDEIVDWWKVNGIVRRANPARYTEIASRYESSLLAPLLEALYHATLRSAEEGYEFFERYCFNYEAENRLTVCASLRSAFAGYFEHLPPHFQSEKRNRWLRYWEARITRQLRRDEEAEKILRELISQAEDDTKLKLWALDELGVSLQNQEKITEARETYERQLALAIEANIDPYNLSLFYQRVANLQWGIDLPYDAAESYRQAIRAARVGNNPNQEANSMFNLASLAQALGEWDEAVDMAIEACNFVHRHLTANKAFNKWQTLSVTLRGLMARRETRLCDTLQAEIEALVADGDGAQSRAVFIDYVDLLRQSGRFVHGERLLEERRKEFEESADYSAFLLARALFFEDQRRHADAINDYSAVIERADAKQATEWQLSVALHNRAALQAETGIFEGAWDDLQRAREIWKVMGRLKLAAYAGASLANLRRRQGRFDDAQALLDEARGELSDTMPGYLASLHRVQGLLHYDLSRDEEAVEAYRQSAAIRSSLDDFAAVARDFHSLAKVESGRGNWRAALKNSGEAQSLWRRLAEINEYHPTDAEKKADAANARATRLLNKPVEDGRQALLQARAALEEAVNHAPANFRFRLNLAGVHAELGEWTEACAEMEAAVECSPEWMRVSALYDRAADFWQRRGEDAAQNSQQDFARTAYDRSREWLERAQSAYRGEFSHLRESWQALGDAYLGIRQWVDATASYEQALALSAAGEAEAALRARLGFIAANRNDAKYALDCFRQYVTLQPAENQPDAANLFVSEWEGLVREPDQYRNLNAMLSAFIADQAVDAGMRDRLIGARFLFQRTAHNPQAPSLSARPLAVEPVIIEADASIFPATDNWWESHPLFKQYLPTMRDHFQSTMGVRIPPVRVRSNEYDLPKGSFIFSINEMPLLLDTLQPGHVFCPTPEVVSRLQAEADAGVTAAGFNPLTFESNGAWVTKELAERLRTDSIEVWDEFEYLTRRLAAFLRPHMTAFFGLQEMTEWLDNWRKDADAATQERRGDAINRALPDLPARLRLLQVLQALLREEAPICAAEAILEAFSKANLVTREVAYIADAVRMSLRETLPGNDPSCLFLRLSDGFQVEMRKWLADQDGKTFFAIPPEETQQMLAAVRDAVSGKVGNKWTLVVTDERIRPFTRRLFEIEFPYLNVLSSRELLPGLQEKISDSIDLP